MNRPSSRTENTAASAAAARNSRGCIGNGQLGFLFLAGCERLLQFGPVISFSALDLGELGHELAAVDLAGDGLTLRVKAQPARALAVGRNTVIGNEISHGSASIVAAVLRQLPFVQILNVGLDLYTPRL